MGNSKSQQYLRPLILMVTLFFMFGMATNINNVLVPYIKGVYQLSNFAANLVTFSFFMGFLVISPLGSFIVSRFGYKNTAVIGLVTMSGGFLLALASSKLALSALESGEVLSAGVSVLTAGGLLRVSYLVFLLATFGVGSGVTILQVAANPYLTALGNPETADSRINTAGFFNSLSGSIAPLVAGMILLGSFGSTSDALRAISLPYMGLIGFTLVVAVVFSFAKLPRLSIETDVTETVKPSGNPLKYKHMWMGVVAIFMYVAAEVSIPTLMVELIRESKMGWSWFSFENAATYGSMYWALVMLGRLAGIFIMQKVQIHKGLIFTSGPALLLVALGMTTTNDLSVLAFVLVGLFNSVMWGAIFPLGIARMGKLTNKASGYMLMGVVGGAIYPLLQGLVADSWGVHASYGIILLPYLFLLYYGLVGHKVKSAPAQV